MDLKLAQRWADEVEKIEADLTAEYHRTQEWDSLVDDYGGFQRDAKNRLRLEATCAWFKIQLGARFGAGNGQ